jgi:hypothetical protein
MVKSCDEKRKESKKEFNRQGICRSLQTIYEEDLYYLYPGKNPFLHEIADTEKEEDRGKYNQVLILLNEEKEYLGHIYMWSWLSFNLDYITPYLLEFGGIRSSMKNLFCGGTRNLGPIFINIIANWAKDHGYTHIRIALTPIGKMPGYMKECEMDKTRTIEIAKMKCLRYDECVELENVSIFYFLQESFDNWFIKERIQDDALLKSMWFGYDIALVLYHLYKMSYPENKPSYNELEFLYMLTFRNDNLGYRTPEQLNSYNLLGEVKQKYSVREWVHLSLLNNLTYEDPEEENTYFVSDPQYKEQIPVEVRTRLDGLVKIAKESDEVRREMVAPRVETPNGWERKVTSKDRELILAAFRLKVQYRNFIAWYEDLIFAMNQDYKPKINLIFDMSGDHNSDAEYNMEEVNSLMQDIRDNFNLIIAKGGHLNRFNKGRKGFQISHIAMRIISLP